jgi:hypothetical protein
MFRKSILLALASGLLLSACATKPLPEDFSGVKTLDIVSKIRCEARSALVSQVVNLLKGSNSEESRSIARKLEDGSIEFDQSLRQEIDRQSKRYIEEYDSGVVAFEFTLDMSETNKVSAGLDLLRPLTGGSIMFGIDTSSELKRQRIRTFFVLYSFEELVVQIKREACLKIESGANFAYPITGNIGLNELFDTFFDVNNLKKLSFFPKTNNVMIDTLKFTTTLTFGADAGLTLKAAGRQWQTVGASGVSTNSRVDLHQVVVSLALPPDPKGTKASAKNRAIEAIEKQRVIRLNQTLQDLGVR